MRAFCVVACFVNIENSFHVAPPLADGNAAGPFFFVVRELAVADCLSHINYHEAPALEPHNGGPPLMFWVFTHPPKNVFIFI